MHQTPAESQTNLGKVQEAAPNKILESGVEQPWLQPPSVEQIKCELKQKSIPWTHYQAQYLRNRKQAIKEILQENVENTVKIKDGELFENFQKAINSVSK